MIAPLGASQSFLVRASGLCLAYQLTLPVHHAVSLCVKSYEFRGKHMLLSFNTPMFYATFLRILDLP